MGEPVEQRAGEPLGAEHGGPFVERQIAGDQGRAAFMALGEHVEQQFSAGARQRHVAQFVDDQEFYGTPPVRSSPEGYDPSDR
jgi:hypothetical protein